MASQRTATDVSGPGVDAPARVPAVDLRSPEYVLQDRDTTEHPEPDPEPTPLPTPSDEFKFTTEQLEAARRQEREKVQSRLSAEKAKAAEAAKELEELRAWREQVQAEAEAKVKADERKAKKEAEKDMSAKEVLAAREAEWEKQREQDQAAILKEMAELRAEREQERALVKLERQALELQNYISTKVNAALSAKTLAPQFVDFITGTSTEQVDAAIELAEAKTAEILAEVAGQQAPSRGVSTATGPTSIGSVTEVESEPIDYSKLTLKEYVEKVRPNLQIEKRDNGIFS